MTQITPREAATTLTDNPQLVTGHDERFTGYGAMGVPFVSGHYLALRNMLGSSVGPAFRAIWHRTPQGQWTIYTTASAEVSCQRYFGAATASEEVVPIALSWPDDWTLQVTMADRLSWRLELASTPATQLMTSMAGAMPAGAWNSRGFLTAMGPVAGGFLGTGRTRLYGITPNGPRFKAAPLRLWRVEGGRATLDGIDLGELGPLPQQDHLGDFWLPQRGLFFVGRARFTSEEIAAHKV